MADNMSNTMIMNPLLMGAMSASGELACMSLSLESCDLILPTVSVAEMAPVRQLEIGTVDVPWILGFYVWRQINVPVMAYDFLNGREDSKTLNPEGRIAVLNNTGVSEQVPFVAIHTQAIPKMIKVGASDISADVSVATGEYDTMGVKLHMQNSIIPNIQKLEHLYAELLVTD